MNDKKLKIHISPADLGLVDEKNEHMVMVLQVKEGGAMD
jgi:hypothetical protein